MNLVSLFCQRRHAGAERGSRLSQGTLNPLCERVRSTEHASRGPFRPLERRHGLVEIVDLTLALVLALVYLISRCVFS